MNGPKFLKEKYSKSGINTSNEVVSAVKRNRIKEKYDVNDKNYLSENEIEPRIQVYLNRLSEIFDEKDKNKKEFRLNFLKQKLYDKFVIKEDEIPESYWQSIINKHKEENRSLPEGDVIPKETKDILVRDIIAEQKDSLDLWLDYFAEQSEQYPDWFKYLAIRNILYLGRYDKLKKKFTERTGGSLAPFPDLNQEALNIVRDALTDDKYDFGYDKTQEVKDKFNSAIKNKNFKDSYQIAIEEFKPVPEELLQITEGQWRTFKAGSDPNILSESLKDWGTGWCIRGKHMAKSYLVDNQNELQVYFTKDKNGDYKVPRVVTVVDNNGNLNEVRGIAYQENLDPYISTVVDEKLKEFPDGESFRKKDSDMKRLTEIYYKCFDKKTKNYLDNILNKEELRFLYQVDNNIEGFGYKDDLRIKEILDKRNKKEDISKIYDCDPKNIITDIDDISENTEIIYKINSDKLQIADLRKLSQEKIKETIKVIQELKRLNSPARPDLFIENGFMDIDINNEDMKYLSTMDKALKKFIDTYSTQDTKDYNITNNFKKFPWDTIKNKDLNTVIINHRETTPAQRDKMVQDMDKLGYRPLTVAELTALIIKRVDLFKKYPNPIFNSYIKHQLGSVLHIPYFGWFGWRRLDANGVSNDWLGRNRFVFVRK